MIVTSNRWDVQGPNIMASPRHECALFSLMKRMFKQKKWTFKHFSKISTLGKWCYIFIARTQVHIKTLKLFDEVDWVLLVSLRIRLTVRKVGWKNIYIFFKFKIWKYTVSFFTLLFMFLQGYEQQALDTPFYHLFGSLRSYVNLSFFLQEFCCVY